MTSNLMMSMPSDIFNNLQALSTQEVIHYADNGTVESIPSDVFLRIVEEYEGKLRVEEADTDERSYDEGYDTGWEEAKNEMRTFLDRV